MMHLHYTKHQYFLYVATVKLLIRVRYEIQKINKNKFNVDKSKKKGKKRAVHVLRLHIFKHLIDNVNTYNFVFIFVFGFCFLTKS